jgi:hypothetical protein
MSEQELEQEISEHNNNLARLTLGRLLIEGWNEKVQKNEIKGEHWVKDLAKKQFLPAVEYATYRDIRTKAGPNIEKIKKNLELCATKGKSARACNTLAEIHMGFVEGEEDLVNANKYFKLAQEYGCMLGNHWMGIHSFMGKGMDRNVKDAHTYFKAACKIGNCQSEYQLYLVYTLDAELKDPVKAYKHLTNALQQGLTRFEDMQNFFNNNYEALAETFVGRQAPGVTDVSKKEENLSMHAAFVNDIRVTFSAALQKDRLYLNACSFI